MNDHHLPPDELASAFLDGELAATDAVRHDPELAARIDELRQAADAVGAPVTPPDGAEDAAVAAALADFDARRSAPADIARQRPRRLTVITGVAAAVAIGFIVAAAVGLFAEREGTDADSTAAAAPPPAPAPRAEAAAAAPATAAAEEFLPEPAPEPPPPAATAPAEDLDHVNAVAEAEVALAEAQAAAGAARADAAAAQAEADLAREAAAAAQSEAAAAQSEAAAAQSEAAAAPPPPAPPAEPPEPALPPPSTEPPSSEPDDVMATDDMAADDMSDMAADDMGPPADGETVKEPEACAAAIGDSTIELRLVIGGTPIIVLTTPDGSLAALDGTTCAEIPTADPTEAVADAAPDGCEAPVGESTIELRLVIGGTPIIVLTTPDGSLAALDGTTCAEIPTG